MFHLVAIALIVGVLFCFFQGLKKKLVYFKVYFSYSICQFLLFTHFLFALWFFCLLPSTVIRLYLVPAEVGLVQVSSCHPWGAEDFSALHTEKSLIYKRHHVTRWEGQKQGQNCKSSGSEASAFSSVIHRDSFLKKSK